MKYFIFLLIFFLTTCCKIFSQRKNFRTSYYTTENGLPSNGIKGLQWDEHTGFLWIATEAGISRFNGLDFTNFTIENTPFIESERMLFIVKNNGGKIYAADQSGNLFFIKNNELSLQQRYNEAQKQTYRKMYTISVSDKFYYDPTNYTSNLPFNLLFDNTLSTSDTSTYIIHTNKLYTFRTGMNEPVRYADSTRNARYAFKLNDKCFFWSDKGELRDLNDDPSFNRSFPIIDADENTLILPDNSGRIYWVNGMENPILINKTRAWLLSLSGDKIKATQICDDMPVDALIEFVQYSLQKKLLFLGTDSKGIIVISQNRVDAMKGTGFNQRNSYYSQILLENGNVLTNEGIEIGNNSPGNSGHPINGKFTYFTSITSDSILWYSQHHPVIGFVCLHSYDMKTGQTKAYPRIPCGEAIVRETSDGKKLLVTEYGVAWLINDSLQYVYRHPQVSYGTSSYGAEEIEPGVFLLATCSGIIKFSIAGKRMDTLLKTPGSCIRSTWKYRDYIFFGSYGKGIFIWKNGVLKSIALDKRKHLAYSHCFMPDDEGYCWISTNRGLFKAKIDELINAYENNSTTVYYHYFGKNDGMDMIEMNGGCNPCAIRLPGKTLSFPTMDGLLWVDPEKAKPILPEGKIFIDNIKADSLEIDFEQNDVLTIPSKTETLSFNLAFPAWCNKENIYIEYQLNDSLIWKPLNTDVDPVILFNNLDPGDYTLRIRKLNGFGINNYSYKTIRFNIPTPWYLMWWFNILIVLAAAGLVLVYVNLRTRQLKNKQLWLEKQVSEKTKELQLKNEVLEKNDSIKTRLISIISHDIVTPLKFLTAAGKNLIEKRNVMSEELQKETLEEMANTSQELQMLSTNILNWIKYQNEHRRLARENFEIHEMVSQVIGILKSLAHQKHLVLKNMAPQHLTMYQYYEPLKILVYNLLTNAINFSERGEILIGAEKENGFVKIWVKDPGVGMTQDQVEHITADEIIITAANVDRRKGHGLGYLIIKDLLKMTGGTLHIQSEKGKGSTISITLPANQKSNLHES
ncbi:MAG TPA: ATP-binding protein [Chitinophagaceae bacterium]